MITETLSIKRLIKSFKYAFQGIGHCLQHEKNMQVHFFLIVVVLTTGYFVGLCAWEWCMVVVCIGMVASAEMLNTAIEKIVNELSPEYNVWAGIVKDIAAGAVLITAVAAVFVAGIIFLPKIANIFF